MNKNPKYLLFGDGTSPHLLKWAIELNKHFNLYILSSTKFSPDFHNILADNQLFKLGFSPNIEGNNKKILFKTREVYKVIKKVKPQFINAHYLTSHGAIIAILKTLKLTKSKTIFSAWGSDILVTPFKSNAYKKITKFILKKGDIITSDSEYMSKIIRDLGGKKIETFPFGLPKLPTVMIEEKDENLFFSNRSLEDNYNIDKIILLFSEICKTQKAKLVIANSGKNLEKCTLLAQKLGISDNVDFVGFLTSEEQNNYYKKAQFFFSIPTSDATSVSLLEAMAYGAIPILSDIPANEEWVTNNENGIIGTEEIVVKINKIKKRREEIFLQNREIISKKAIFPDLIESFAQKLKSNSN